MRKPFARLSRLAGLVPFTLALGLTLAAPLASATVLTFDDLGSDGLVPVNYGGLDWSASSWFQYAGEQAPFTPHSGDHRATLGWDGSADTSAIGFTTASVFSGAWFAGYQGVSITIDLYYGGTRVGSTSTLDLSDSPTFLASGYSGAVDRLVFRSNDPANFVMDDLSFTSAVPEPGTGALALAGLGLVGLFMRRRRVD
ncbi:PEP-CTERM sorting domain-containing protein [Roseateles amylovorans]|uniref:PEP-CTERM sorting domain-containing protein n=1 Tax=Roseateles amylovorans TaxID=2978473 RepID=A0ABY6B064_9BURK|nr:PEP-CTERM sorting domain-containing protein [Roseateles amylovorans]UXH78225.1 PEP-CTERM sorting domain-containing protein [Roseateles amylovorans]